MGALARGGLDSAGSRRRGGAVLDPRPSVRCDPEVRAGHSSLCICLWREGKWPGRRPSFAAALPLYLADPDRGYGHALALEFAAFSSQPCCRLRSSHGASAQDRRVPASPNELRLSYAPVVQRVAPAVVNVYAAKTVGATATRCSTIRSSGGSSACPEWAGRGPGEQVQRSLGSGVMVDASGLVVTNNHVIEGADQVKVSLADKREFEAEIVLKDARSDLAVLRLKAQGERFPALEFSDSDALAGRRRRARDRQSVRRRPDRDPRHRLGAGAHAGRHHRLPVLHPDRRRHQSGQFRRRAGRPRRQARRHQHRDLLALGRLAGHRLRHSRPTWCEVVVASAQERRHRR